MELEIKDLKVGMTVLFTETGIPRCYFKEYPIKLKITTIDNSGYWSDDFPENLLSIKWEGCKILCLTVGENDWVKFETI